MDEVLSSSPASAAIHALNKFPAELVYVESVTPSGETARVQA